MQVESLSPLGPEAVEELARDALGERADPALAEVSLEVTGGNPFYLHELLLALGEEPGRVRRRADPARPRAGPRRGDPLAAGPRRPARARRGALARAVAILGADVPLRRAAALAGLSIDAASAAADALAGVEVLLAREPLRFVHPLVQHAIAQDIPPFERGSRHLDAARLLYADGEDVELVAAHLLLGHAGGDPWVVEQLRAAAREARGRPAGRALPRARPRGAADAGAAPRGLAELGAAEAALGHPAAAEHLAQAVAGHDRSAPARRARRSSSAARSTPRRATRRRPRPTTGLSELPAEPDEPEELELRDQLEASFISTASIVPDLQPRRARALDPGDRARGQGPRTQGQRLLLAQAALHATTAGESAHNAVELAERAWDGGRMLAEANPQWIGLAPGRRGLPAQRRARERARGGRRGARRRPPARLAAGVRHRQLRPRAAAARGRAG